MGCAKSSQFNGAVIGYDEAKTAAIFDELNFNKLEINEMFSEYKRMDDLSQGSASYDNIYKHYKIDVEFHIFPMLFELLNNDVGVNFLEFVCVFWNFLTLNPNEMQLFIVLLYFHGNTGRILSADLEKLMQDIHGSSYSQNATLRVLVERCKAFGYDLELIDFLRLGYDYSLWISPILKLQFNLRKSIVGKSFWDNLTLKREAKNSISKGSYIFALHDKLLQAKSVILESEASHIPKCSNSYHEKSSALLESKPFQLLSYFNICKRVKLVKRRSTHAYLTYKQQQEAGDMIQRRLESTRSSCQDTSKYDKSSNRVQSLRVNTSCPPSKRSVASTPESSVRSVTRIISPANASRNGHNNNNVNNNTVTPTHNQTRLSHGDNTIPITQPASIRHSHLHLLPTSNPPSVRCIQVHPGRSPNRNIR